MDNPEGIAANIAARVHVVGQQLSEATAITLVGGVEEAATINVELSAQGGGTKVHTAALAIAAGNVFGGTLKALFTQAADADGEGDYGGQANWWSLGLGQCGSCSMHEAFGVGRLALDVLQLRLTTPLQRAGNCPPLPVRCSS
jgi:hypothetical protein